MEVMRGMAGGGDRGGEAGGEVGEGGWGQEFLY